MNGTLRADADHSDASQRVQRDAEAVSRHLEQHFGLPCGVLMRGFVTQASSPRGALWTAQGGFVGCTDASLSASISAAVAKDTGRDYPGLSDRLKRTVIEKKPGASCGLDILLGCWAQVEAATGSPAGRVERLRPGDPGVPDVTNQTENVFAIRRGSTVLSYAWHAPRLQVDDHWLHSVGVQTHPDFRNKGLGKAVVSSLVQHIVSEGGCALWNCDVRNVASLRLALSTGFRPLVCIFRWGVSDENANSTRLTENRQ